MVENPGTCHIFFIMSSQLPNAYGEFYGNNVSRDCDVYSSGVIRFPCKPGAFNVAKDYQTSYGGRNGFTFDLSRASNIYKNHVTQVFGDSLSYNIFIKALL